MQHYPCMCFMSPPQCLPTPSHWLYYSSDTWIILQRGDMDVGWKWSDMDPLPATIFEGMHQTRCTCIVQECDSVAFGKPFHLLRFSQLQLKPPDKRYCRQSSPWISNHTVKHTIRKHQTSGNQKHIKTPKTIWNLEGVPSMQIDGDDPDWQHTRLKCITSVTKLVAWVP